MEENNDKNKKYIPIILKVLFYTILLLFTTLVNYYDFNSIGIRSSIVSNIWSIIVCVLGFILGINYINKKKIGLGVFFISISSIMIFENIVLVFLKTS